MSSDTGTLKGFSKTIKCTIVYLQITTIRYPPSANGLINHLIQYLTQRDDHQKKN
jgi:hypothetical protein